MLTITQKKILNSAKTAGTELGVGLTSAQCSYLMVLIISDLNLPLKLEINTPELPGFFNESALTFSGITGVSVSLPPFMSQFELESKQPVDTRPAS